MIRVDLDEFFPSMVSFYESIGKDFLVIQLSVSEGLNRNSDFHIKLGMVMRQDFVCVCSK